jgi:hypothetical protein
MRQNIDETDGGQQKKLARQVVFSPYHSNSGGGARSARSGLSGLPETPSANEYRPLFYVRRVFLARSNLSAVISIFLSLFE